MKFILTGAAGFAILASMGQAGGMDRSGQSVSAIFNDPGTFTFSLGSVAPSITGGDNFTASTYDVADSYTQMSFSYTHALSDNLSVALIFDQPFGAAVEYDASPATSFLGGTSGALESEALTLVAKYKVSDRFSLFGGLRAERVKADVALNGIGYVGALGSDYAVEVAQSSGIGYVLGAAYEIPDIALRASLTYNSAIEHDADTVEYFAGGAVTVPSTITYKAPQSVNLEFQTGIAQNTLLTAGVRWAEWGAVDLIPTALGSDLVNLDDTFTYSLGVARRFNENFAGSISLTYEAEGDDLVSPLGPTNGVFGITIGGQYTMDNVTVSGGVNFSWPGDAQASLAGTGVSSFDDNSVVGVGFRVSVAM